MLQTPRRLRPTLGAVGMIAILFAACATSAITPPAKAIPATHDFTITAGHSFSPFIQVVPMNSTVAFINNDSINHDFVSTDDSNAFLNPAAFSSMLAPHSEQETTFSQPGVYEIYDDVLGKWNPDQHRVTALRDTPISTATPYPSAVECILWVQGDISGLPATAQNTFTSDSVNFQTNFVAITKGGTVSWQNASAAAMTMQTVPGWSAPLNPVAIPPTTIAPNNGTKTITFTTPGLYYYYSSTYADVDPTTHRAVAHAGSASYPVPTEGFVLVQ